MLGPDLADQLRRKVKIVLKHWEDFEQLFDEETREPGAPGRGPVSCVSVVVGRLIQLRANFQMSRATSWTGS